MEVPRLKVPEIVIRRQAHVVCCCRMEGEPWVGCHLCQKVQKDQKGAILMTLDPFLAFLTFPALVPRKKVVG